MTLTKEQQVIYQKEYRAKHRERLNAQSKECMQIKRAKEKAEQIYEQRVNPKPALFVKKSMRQIKEITKKPCET